MSETPVGGEQPALGATGILGVNNLQRAIDTFDKAVNTLSGIAAKWSSMKGAYGAGQNFPGGGGGSGSWNQNSNWSGGSNGGNATMGGAPWSPTGGAHAANVPTSYFPSSSTPPGGAYAGAGNGFANAAFAAGAVGSAYSSAQAFYGGQTTAAANNDRLTYSSAAWQMSTGPVNATAMYSRYGGGFLSGTDQAQALSTMATYAGSPNSARFVSAQQSLNQFALANPMQSGATLAAQSKQMYSPAGIFGLRKVGVQTVSRGGQQRSALDIANQILNEVDPGQTVRTKQQADTLTNDQNGPLMITLGNWVSAGIISGDQVTTIVNTIKDILRARQNGVGIQGLQSLENSRTNGSSAAATKLKSMGIGSSDMQLTKDLGATERQPAINNISSFDKGLQQSTQSLTEFKNTINDIMKATGLNYLTGLNSGTAANGKLGYLLGANKALSGIPGGSSLSPVSGLLGGLSGLGEVGHLMGLGGSRENRMSVTSHAGGGGGSSIGTGGAGGNQGGSLAGGGSSGGGAGGSSHFIYPVGRAPITEAYGVKNSGYAAGHHTGVDFGVPVGTPVHAAAAGTVVDSGWGGDYGNYIVIDHHNGLWTLYGHNSRLLVHVGAQVRQGQVISYSGNTGNTTGPHLHFEVRKGANRYGMDVNPMPYLGGASLPTPTGGSPSGSSSSGSPGGTSGGSPTTGAGSSTSLGMGTSYTVTSSGGGGTSFGAGMSELDVLSSAGSSGGGSTSVTYGGDPSMSGSGISGGSPQPGGSSYTGPTGNVGTSVGGPNASLGGGPTGLSGNRSIVNSVAAGYGWNKGAEWAALSALVASESSWNNTAQNPTSTAYGLFQFLDSTWAGYGPKTSDASRQAVYGLEYIKRRYGDPIHAWAFHKAHNWYDKGAWDIKQDETARVHKGEMILPAQAARQIREILVNGNPYGAKGKSSGGAQIIFQPDSIRLTLQGSGTSTSAEGRSLGKEFVDAVTQDQRIQRLMAGSN